MYCFHFEPLTDYRHENERPIAWVVRCYKGSNARGQYAANEPYIAQITLVRSCLNIAEAKGLNQTITASMFKQFLTHLPKYGIEILEVKRHGKMHIYEIKDWT